MLDALYEGEHIADSEIWSDIEFLEMWSDTAIPEIWSDTALPGIRSNQSLLLRHGCFGSSPMNIGEIMAIHRFHGIISMIDKYLTISSLLTFLVRFLNEEC